MKGQNPAFKGKLYYKSKSEHLLLPVPIELQKYIRSFFDASGIKIKDIPSAFKALTKKLNSSLRYTLLSTYISYHYKMKGIDKHSRSLLTGDKPQQNSALYYTMVFAENIYANYKAVMDDLSIPIPPCSQGRAVIGSVLIPNKTYLKMLFKEQFELIQKYRPQTMKEWIRHHNRVAVYTYTLLNLCTSHRPTVSAYDNIANFDLHGQFCFIKDKCVRSTNSGRMIPLTQVATEQLESYKKHLEAFKLAIRFYQNSAALVQNIEHCKNANSEKYPFLFMVIHRKTPKIIPPAPRYMSKIIHRFWPLPLNWNRHYLRSYLTGKISPESIDAYMGHGQFGASPETPISGFSFNEMHTVRNQLQAMCDMLEIKAL